MVRFARIWTREDGSQRVGFMLMEIEKEIFMG